tara:strand:+ start:1442 stop:1858 length:417 start_codon:yes stop_codon:yes gene_type:complete
MPKKKQSEKQEQRNRLKALYPDAVSYMAAALRDELKDQEGKKIVATVGQKLDIAKQVVDQVVGRPAQSVALGGDPDRPPITTLEVVKTYDGMTTAAEPGLDALIPAEEPEAGPRNRDEWLKKVEDEALAGMNEPPKAD